MLMPSNTRVYVYGEPTDMRRSFEGLSYLAREVVKEDVLSGHLFLFFNRSRSSVKILWWDNDGYVIWYKQLQCGAFTRPAKRELEYAELVCVLKGLEFEKMPRKSRFSAKLPMPQAA